jgi:dihydrofolate reductase
MTLTVVNHVTLDGVMQAPARADEDTRAGFADGGWSVPYGDDVMAAAMGARMAKGAQRGGALLLGRRTYLDLFAVWPNRTDNPFTEVLNKTEKFVVSTTLQEPLPWQNSTLIADPGAAVPELKQECDLTVIGSGVLVQSLMHAGLVDEYLLTIHPLVLGAGRRLFPDGSPHTALTLIDCRPTTTGVIIATYRPASP